MDLSLSLFDFEFGAEFEYFGEGFAASFGFGGAAFDATYGNFEGLVTAEFDDNSLDYWSDENGCHR
jgi:hypothetical protein